MGGGKDRLDDGVEFVRDDEYDDPPPPQGDEPLPRFRKKGPCPGAVEGGRDTWGPHQPTEHPADAEARVWGTLHVKAENPSREGMPASGFHGSSSAAAGRTVQTMVCKVADEKPICGCCKEEIHPKVSICLPKDATLRSDALAAVPGHRHGRVHSECAFPQVLLKHWASGNCKRMRAVTYNQLFDMMNDLNCTEPADDEWNVKHFYGPKAPFP